MVGVGEMLRIMLDHHGLSQREFCKMIGRPKKTLNEIIMGKTIITEATALQLEKSLKISADVWLHWQVVDRIQRKRRAGRVVD